MVQPLQWLVRLMDNMRPIGSQVHRYSNRFICYAIGFLLQGLVSIINASYSFIGSYCNGIFRLSAFWFAQKLPNSINRCDYWHISYFNLEPMD
ncbi:MAG: hypothetical protein NQ127_04435 [Candidatus Cardinium sp.]|nr:hypothetical protein [Candidatus Cardinium sp.]